MYKKDVVGPMGRRTNGSKDQWVVGQMGRKTNDAILRLNFVEKYSS